MRALGALVVLLASAAWVPTREPPAIATTGHVRGEPVLADVRALPATWRGVRVVAGDVPVGWRAMRDRDTGVVAQLWGGSVHVPGAMADAALAERAARAFVTAHLALLAPGAASGDFATVTNRVDGRVRTIALEQRARGLRVVGGSIAVVFANDRLFAVMSQALPTVTITPPPRRAKAQRLDAWIGEQVRVRATGERVVLPLIDDAGRLAYHVADVLDVEATLGGERWDVYVTPDGAPLLRESRVRRASGTLRFDAGVRRPGGARMAYPAAAANVTVDGSAQVAGDDGSITWNGTASAALIAGLTGTFVTVVNQAGSSASTTLTIAPGETVTWASATDEQVDAQLSAFVHASIGKQHARRIFPSLASWLDLPLSVFVNENGECNASSSDDGLHFYRAGAACENTARLADVVYHELGHSLHRAALIPGVGVYQAPLSEGLSDFFAANINDDPGVGRGFLLDDRALRDLDPTGYELVYPADIAPSPHGTGMILAGALWDLRRAFIAEHGEAQGIALAETIYAGVVQRAPNLPGAYLAAQIADDDDGDLGNGTPHACAIQAAFGKHGLAEPTFETTRIGTPVVEGLSITVTVTAPTGTACPVPQVTSVSVQYEAGGGAPQTFTLQAAGAAWTGTFPSLPPHTAVTYAITATLDDQSTVILPRNAADPRYQLFTGEVDEIWCERFDGDPGWSQQGSGDWEVSQPASSSTSGDPAEPFTGALALGTQLDGDGRYASDATSSIETPPIDASAWTHVRLQYRRWLTVEDGQYDRAELEINGTTAWSNAATDDGTLTHVDREWRLHDLDVTAHAGSPLTIRWSLTTDGTRELGGWTIDDVCLVGYDKRATPDGEPGPSEDPGCCSSGAAPTSPLLLALLVVLRSRRRTPK